MLNQFTNPRPVILLVDDNPHDVILIRLAFRKVGIIDTIQLVKDGAEAMRYIQGEGIYADRDHYPQPTLVLLDLKMPQTSGFRVLEWIRSHDELAQLIVVVMSGSRDDADIKRAYELGANSYLVKPTKFEDLVKMMESLKDYCNWRQKNLKGATGLSPVSAPRTAPSLPYYSNGSTSYMPA
ncbi:MAG: response regulator [Verrucomicrobiota bacterium]|nr:response regulator [Verrucomicrobiota bacterium]